MDKLFACPPSVFGGEGMVPVSTQGEPALIGKVVHELLAEEVAGSDAAVASACNRHGVIDEAKREEVGKLLDYGLKVWGELGKYFPQPAVECAVGSEEIGSPIGPVQLDGTVDVLSPIGASNGVFLDWKTGWLDAGYVNQGFAYAVCMWHLLGQPEDCTITGCFAFLRHRYYRVVKYRPKDMQDWLDDLRRNVLARADRKEFSPGAHCNYCSYYATCTARRRVAEGMIDTLLLGQTHESNEKYQDWLKGVKSSIEHMTEGTADEAAEAVATLYERTKMLDKAVMDLKEMLRSSVEQHGPLPLGDGTELAMEEQERRKLQSVPAMRVLRRHMSDTQIAEAMNLSLPKLLDIFGKQHHRNDRGDFKRALAEELDDAGAIAHSKMTKMTVRQSERPLESISRATIKEGTDDAGTDGEHSDGSAEIAGAEPSA
jgi:hypothetical protein